MVHKKLLESAEEVVDFAAIRLKHLFEFTNEDAIRFFAKAGALKNEMRCDKCQNMMNIQKLSSRQDGIRWVCRNNKVQCSTKSSGSFFEESHLPLSLSLQLIYMWANDFDNKQISRELELSPKTVVDWLNMCREICGNYCHNQEPLGGPEKFIEIDETCITEHRRGKPKKGASQWVFEGVEREKDGLSFAFRVPNRTKKTLYPLIRKHIAPGTTIISDDWPAYRKVDKQFGKPIGYKHYIICHKKMFARTVKENGKSLQIHTNKAEGSWAHMKHKMKCLYGTTNVLLASYVAEAVFRQNCRAKGWSVLEKLFDQMKKIYSE